MQKNKSAGRSHRAARRRLAPETKATLETIERAVDDTKSVQPRFQKGVKPDAFFSSVMRMLEYADLQEPEYSPDSRRRDQWLRDFWRIEPHLAGVMNSVVSLDKNRGWSITGGRNQVYRVTDTLHMAEAAPGLSGWRNYFSAQALSYYATDLCTVSEVGRDGPGGPMRALYHTDSARCRLTGDPEYPLEYYPSIFVKGKPSRQRWPYGSFFRVVSMPSDNEAYNGLGYCAISRVLEIAKLMVAIYRKDAELLGARMPEGLLLLQGIGQDQWDAAMADREAKLTAKERKYFGGVFVLATAGIDQVDAKLVALRQLPEQFNMQVFTDQLMFAYALTFGYSPREFWPVSSGALGTATEAETQDANSTGKGESDFILNYQEQLNDELPESVWFEFDQRDAKGDLELTEIKLRKAAFIDAMSKLSAGGVPLVGRGQLLQLGAQEGLLSEEWLEMGGDASSTDVKDATVDRWREAARLNPSVQRAMVRYPHEPIIRYSYPDRREFVLFENAAAVHRGRSHTGYSAGDSQIERLTEAVRQLAASGQAQSNGPAPAVNIITSADGAAIVRQNEPINVVVNVDTATIADAIGGALLQMPAPNVRVDVAGAVVNVPPAEVTVNVPTSPAPIVNVSPAPVVVQPAEPQVDINVEPPAQSAHFTIEYDRAGKPVGVTKTPGKA